jgi:hypothetical protein
MKLRKARGLTCSPFGAGMLSSADKNQMARTKILCCLVALELSVQILVAFLELESHSAFGF